MSEEFGRMIAEIKAASEAISAGDSRFHERLNGAEHGINELYARLAAPARRPPATA